MSRGTQWRLLLNSTDAVILQSTRGYRGQAQTSGRVHIIFQKGSKKVTRNARMVTNFLTQSNGIKTDYIVKPVKPRPKPIGDKVYIAIDPGKTTGYALFDSSGIVTFTGKITGEDKFLDELETLVAAGNIKVMIIEIYRNRPHMKHNNWSKNETSQIIGATKRIARKAGIKVVEQEPSPALAIGLKFLGISHVYAGKHVPDDVAALAHGTYYLRQQKVL